MGNARLAADFLAPDCVDITMNTNEYLPRAAQAAYALLYEDAPYPPSVKPLRYFGPFADVISELRTFHEQVVQLSATNGKVYDVWSDARAVWEGLRSGDDGSKQYGLLDKAIQQIGWALADDAPPAPTVSEQLATNGKLVPTTEYTYDWSQSGTTAADLQRRVFSPLRWIIDGILPESACLFAAKPKSKKSWFALACAVAVAVGGKVLGHYDVTKGRVLVLDLESNQRRMKDRLNAIIGDTVVWPDNLHVFTEWPKGDEGIAMLDAWMELHPDTNLVVIDIFENFRSPRDPKGNPYEQDYAAAKALTQFAERHRIAVLVIHHTRKAKADDVFDEISGTNGIAGGFASMWILSRTNDNGQDEQIFAIRGRDISDDEPKAVKWDGYTCQHVLVATGREVSSSAGRRAILEVMDEEQEYQLKEIAAMVNKTVSAVANQMRRLMDDNLVHRVGNGRYARVILRESSERRERNESSESRESDYANMHITQLSLSHDFHMGDVKVGSALESPKQAQNGDFHDFHHDIRPPEKNTEDITDVKNVKEPARDVIARLKHRGTPRVLTEREINDLMTKDNPDTTFTALSGTPIEEDDHATQREEPRDE